MTIVTFSSEDFNKYVFFCFAYLGMSLRALRSVNGRRLSVYITSLPPHHVQPLVDPFPAFTYNSMDLDLKFSTLRSLFG